MSTFGTPPAHWFPSRCDRSQFRRRQASPTIHRKTPASTGSLGTTWDLPATIPRLPRISAASDGCGPVTSRLVGGNPAKYHTSRAGIGDVHASTGHDHCERLNTHHRRLSRRLLRSGHLDHHFVRRGQWRVGTADGVADAPIWSGADIRGIGCVVYGRVISLRHFHKHDGVDSLSRPARRRFGTHHPGAAGTAAHSVPREQEGNGARDLVDDHPRGTDLWPDPRWLHLRQLPVGLDLPHQRTCGYFLCFRLLALAVKARERSAQAQDRRRRTGAAGG